MTEPDKYRLKAERLVNVARSHKDNFYDNPLDGWQQNEFCVFLANQICDALAEAAREATERATQIVESHMKSSDYAFLYCMKPIKEIVEAIHKEANQIDPKEKQ